MSGTSEPQEPQLHPREQQLRSLVASGDQDAVISAVAAMLADAEALGARRAASVSAAPGLSAATAPPAASAGFIAHKFKLPEPPKPEAFFGDPRRSPSARSFLFQLENYFSGWPEMSDSQKVYFASLYLKGSALLWWQSECHTHRTNAPFASFDAFQSALLNSFEEFNHVERARHDLALCRQFSSVKQYIDVFRSICFRIPTEQLLDAEKKQRFVDGLKPYVRTQVLLKFPHTFDEAAELADQIDRVSNDYKYLSYQRSTKDSHRHYSTSAASSTTASTAPVPMELDSIESNDSRPNGRKPLTLAQKRYLMANDGCFYCRKINAGHRAQNCPDKHKSN